MQYEQISFKEALIISYENDSTKGKIGLKTDHSGYEAIKDSLITSLTEQGFKISYSAAFYLTEDQFQAYLN